MDPRHEPRQRAVLVVTADPALENEVRTAAVGSGVEVSVVADPAEALAAWHEASVVLVGGDSADATAALRPPRRRGLWVVNLGSATPEVFRRAFELGAAEVLELPTAQDWLADALLDAGLGTTRPGAVVGIVSAAGGSGATSLAVATACLGVAYTTTALVDLDPVGVGIERVVGYDGPSVTTWATLGSRSLSPPALREALPVHDGVHLVGFGNTASSPVDAAAASSVLGACHRAFGLTVVDLARAPSAALREAIDRCDLVVMCCPQSVGAVLAGARLLAVLETPRRAVVVTRTGPRSIDAEDVAEVLQIPLLTQVGDQRGLDEAIANAFGPLRSRGSGLRRAAQAVLAELKLSA